MSISCGIIQYKATLRPKCCFSLCGVITVHVMYIPIWCNMSISKWTCMCIHWGLQQKVKCHWSSCSRLYHKDIMFLQGAPVTQQLPWSLEIEILHVVISSNQSHSTAFVYHCWFKWDAGASCGMFFFVSQTLVWNGSSRNSGSTFQLRCVLSLCAFPLSPGPSACILCSASKVNRHRFGALGTTHLTHYSKC